MAPLITNSFMMRLITMLGLQTEKLKVYQFQICCARTKYLSEIHKSRTITVCAAKLQFVSDLKGSTVKNWVKFGSSDF